MVSRLRFVLSEVWLRGICNVVTNSPVENQIDMTSASVSEENCDPIRNNLSVPVAQVTIDTPISSKNKSAVCKNLTDIKVPQVPTIEQDPVPVVTVDDNTSTDTGNTANINQTEHLNARCVVKIKRLSTSDIAKLTEPKVSPDLGGEPETDVSSNNEQQKLLRPRSTPSKMHHSRKASMTVLYANIDKTSSESDNDERKKPKKKI